MAPSLRQHVSSELARESALLKEAEGEGGPRRRGRRQGRRWRQQARSRHLGMSPHPTNGERPAPRRPHGRPVPRGLATLLSTLLLLNFFLCRSSSRPWRRRTVAGAARGRASTRRSARRRVVFEDSQDAVKVLNSLYGVSLSQVPPSDAQRSVHAHVINCVATGRRNRFHKPSGAAQIGRAHV